MLPNRRSELEESGTPSFWLTLALLPCQLGHERLGTGESGWCLQGGGLKARST